MGKSTQDEVGEFRVVIEKKKGAWLDEYFPQGGDRKSRLPDRTLIEEGINKKESANARLVNKEAELVAEALDLKTKSLLKEYKMLLAYI